MAESYRAVTRFKLSEDEYLERGEKVTAKDAGGKEGLERLIESGSILESSDFDEVFPNFDKKAKAAANAVSPSEVEAPDQTGEDDEEEPESTGDEK